MEPDGDGSRRRHGHCPEGWLDERHATAAALAATDKFTVELAEEARRAREAPARKPTIRELAREWLEWLEQVRGQAVDAP